MHGLGYQPHLLIRMQAPSNKITKITPIIDTHIKLRHPSNWNLVSHAMQEVIRNPKGTGIHFGRHPGYSLAAKTGTAQVYGKKRDEVHHRNQHPLQTS